MGRNRRRPEGYAPFLELYLRRKLEGGKLRVPGAFRGTPDAQTRRECLVLIHGFNNTDSEAAEAYLGFRARQREIFAPTDRFTFERRFGDAFWPGDADWSFLDRLDFINYPVAVHTAPRAAKELANLLWRMPNLERVEIIAHSLGCRVALETLLLLRKRTLPLVGRVVLMAAAVPSEMLERGGRFFDLLMELAAERTGIRVLHSRKDAILHHAFPPGQSLAGGREASNRALGRFGPSPMMPGYRTNLSEREIPGAGHGDYWGNSKSSASRAATDDAGRFLTLGDIGREVGVRRDLGSPAIEQPARDIGSVRELSEPG